MSAKVFLNYCKFHFDKIYIVIVVGSILLILRKLFESMKIKLYLYIRI